VRDTIAPSQDRRRHPGCRQVVEHLADATSPTAVELGVGLALTVDRRDLKQAPATYGNVDGRRPP